MQEKASSASFAHLGRKYLQPSSHVPATVLARTCNRPRTYLREKTIIALFFLLTPGIHIPKLAGKKKTVSPLGHSLICMYEDVFF